jgi:peptidoglycan-N-acetylglucosamine deacetylase
MSDMGVDRRTVLAAIGAGVIAAITRAPVASAARAPVGVLMRLPGDGNQLALTVDDGASSAVVAAFGQFCRDTGTRLTFFVNGDNPSWSDNAAALRPMVDSGQIQVGNHTWSHPYLNRVPTANATAAAWLPAT